MRGRRKERIWEREENERVPEEKEEGKSEREKKKQEEREWVREQDIAKVSDNKEK